MLFGTVLHFIFQNCEEVLLILYRVARKGAYLEITIYTQKTYP